MMTKKQKQAKVAKVMREFKAGKLTSGGDLTGVGAKGVNNYNELWHARKVYATL